MAGRPPTVSNNNKVNPKGKIVGRLRVNPKSYMRCGCAEQRGVTVMADDAALIQGIIVIFRKCWHLSHDVADDELKDYAVPTIEPD